ncbi:MAG: polyprenyl synthetase family protein, partial [Candidatus Acidiferrales bacterium]
GKPVLSDLKEGKVTLPLIFALENGAGHDGHPSGREMVATVLREKGFQSVHPEQITSLVRNSGALEHSRQLAVEYANRAKASLDVCKDSEYRRALLSVPDFILDRES